MKEQEVLLMQKRWLLALIVHIPAAVLPAPMLSLHPTEVDPIFEVALAWFDSQFLQHL